MHTIDLMYWNEGEANLGDMLNIAMTQNLFGYRLKRLAPFDPYNKWHLLSYDAVFVGSVLEWLIVPSKSFKSFVRVALGKCVKPIKIWGAGFLAPESPNRWGGGEMAL